MLFSKDMTADSPLRQRICDLYLADEASVIADLLSQVHVNNDERNKIAKRTQALIRAIKKQQKRKKNIDVILNEYSLISNEGRAIMCLAEALLRVPDNYNVGKLIRDKLCAADWQSHLGQNKFLSINLLTRALLLASNILALANDNSLFKRLIYICCSPLIYKCVQRYVNVMASQFVLSQTISGALQASEALHKQGYCFSYDMLGESARTKHDEQRYFQCYKDAITSVGKQAKHQSLHDNPSISVKLSALHCRYEFLKQDQVNKTLIPRLKQLALLAKKYNIGLTIDAEESARLELSLDIFQSLYLDADLAQWHGFGLAVQAYQKRASGVIDWLIALASNNKRQIPVRLVKGAYWDSEIKWAQEQGLADYPVFTDKAATDVSYFVCAQKLLNARPNIYPQFATHNAYTVASILQLDNSEAGYEFQRLHQMGMALYDHVLKSKQVQCRIYAPIGKHVDLLSYLVRRMLENGANSSFVNNVVDEGFADEALLIDPVENLPTSGSILVRPHELYENEFKPPRSNSKGMALSDKKELNALKKDLTTIAVNRLNYLPPAADLVIRNPANSQETIGGLELDRANTVEQKIHNAQLAFKSWSTTSVSERSHYLNLIAQQLEANQAELVSFCIKEAGKTLADSLSEVREAVDFCRYYACQAERLFANNEVVARGPTLCISPWNFPLAIFIGQVVAALATGNTVLAKPAEQTSLIAQFLVELINKTGIPEDCIQLLLGKGLPIGKLVIPDKRIQSVMFTGSCRTAAWINKTLSTREDNAINFIAETGGQNAMVVDSTALLEKVVDDVIKSGFHSAGQRCSSLRVLYVQEEVADELIVLLQGAMAELSVGDPEFIETDIGPIIDENAIKRLEAHCLYLKHQRVDIAKLLFECHLNNNLTGGHYFAPRLYEINSIKLLKEEVFGPVVHLIRFKPKEIDKVIADINETGYGLTLGIHSRLDTFADYLARNINVGNVYINRNMVGAIVGVQPFGGRSLSGTGPKAGGQHYLEALVKHKTRANNVTLVLGKQCDEPVDLTVIEQALDAWPSWQQQTLEQRRAALPRQQLAASLFEEVEAKLNSATLLPGPTGEMNRYRYQSRGVVLVIGDETTAIEEYLAFIFAALYAGNVLICAMPEQDQTPVQSLSDTMLSSGLTQFTCQCVDYGFAKQLLEQPEISAVISPVYNHQIKLMLAQRAGPIIPLIIPSDCFALNRLLLEKTISTDTTAAIGNVMLLSQ